MSWCCKFPEWESTVNSTYTEGLFWLLQLFGVLFGWVPIDWNIYILLSFISIFNIIMYYRYIYLLPNAMYLSLVPKIDTWRREGNEICKFIEDLVFRGDFFGFSTFIFAWYDSLSKNIYISLKPYTHCNDIFETMIYDKVR